MYILNGIGIDLFQLAKLFNINVVKGLTECVTKIAKMTQMYKGLKKNNKISMRKANFYTVTF